MDFSGMSKKRIWLIRFAICFAGYGLFSDNVMIPLVTTLMSEFPNASLFTMNYVISGSAIASMIAGLLTGLLLKKLRRRPLLILGTVMFVVGGIGGVFSQNLEFLAVMRTIDAVSDGILTVTTATMIVELWQTEKDQSFMFGLYNSVSGLFGCVASIIAGYAALVNWHLAFLANSFGIIAIILCIFFAPDTKPEDKLQETGETETGTPEMPFHLVRFICGFLAFNILQTISYMIVMLLDVFIAEQQMGNSVVTGYMGLIPLIIGTVGNMTASVVLTRFRNKYLFATLFCGLEMLAFLGMGMYCHSIPALCIYMAINVVAQCWFIIYYDVSTANSVPARHRSICMSILLQATYIDTILCTYVPSILKKVCNANTLAECCTVCSAIIGCVMLIYLILSVTKKRKAYSYI